MTMTTTLVHHAELGRLIRAEDWEGLATGTYRRLVCAIDESAPETADLMRYFCTEARIIFDIYTQWRRDTLRYLSDKGLPEAELAAEAGRIHALAVSGRPALITNRDHAW